MMAPPAPAGRPSADPEVLFAEAHARRRRRRRRAAGAVASLVAAGLLAFGLAAAWPGLGKPAGQVQPGPDLAAAPSGVRPSYYVTLALGYPDVLRATVRDSATGAALATVKVPPLGARQVALAVMSGASARITAAADDRTFVITQTGSEPAGSAATAGTPKGTPVKDLVRFYLLRVGANGRSAALSALPVSVSGFAVDGVALSPDGSRLAFAGDGRGYRLLSVAGPGGNLLAASRPMVSPAAVALGRVPPALITPDGSALITSTARNIPEGNGRDTVVAKIVELSARTGQLLRVLHTVTKRDVMPGPDGVDNAIALDGDCRVMALGPTGVHALIECFGFGRLDGGRFTPLPGVPNFNATTFSANDFSGAATW